VYRFDSDFSMRTLVDAMFVVGMIFFSFGILTSSNVRKSFRGFAYTFNRVFKRNYKHLSFYDYVIEKEAQKKEPVTGVAAMLVGLIHIVVSVIISVQYFL
jgi:hypothetical protein